MFPLMFGRALKQPLRMPHKMMLGIRLIYVHCAVKSTPRQNVVNVIRIIVRNVLTRRPMGPRLFIEQSCLFNLSAQIWRNKVVKVIQTCFSCSTLCTDGLLLHLVGKRHINIFFNNCRSRLRRKPPPLNLFKRSSILGENVSLSVVVLHSSLSSINLSYKKHAVP